VTALPAWLLVRRAPHPLALAGLVAGAGVLLANQG
jgi:hypothetical protein